MPRTPIQKTVDNPRQLGGMDIIFNNIIPYDVPRYTDGNLWRYVAIKQPVVQACITSMVMYAQSLPWDIRAVEAKDNKKRQDEIDYHKKIFKDAGGAKRLNHLDFLIQDYYTVPFGGASEAVRYSDGRLFKTVNIDAATLYPTNNPTIPVMQKVGVHDPIFYKADEINRMYQTPRTEIQKAGWGTTPVEKVYLAVELLSRGDKYYAQLLLDTPEAGLLDLGDMGKESAEKWLESFKNLVSGIDAFKIPVLYEHTVAAKFIPFGRPPTELMFNDVTFKYAELICAAFGISVGDIGYKHAGGGASLSGQLRDEHHSKATGYASLKAHLVEYYNFFLPEGLEFIFIDTDDELLVAKGRARSANSVGLRNLIEVGVMTPKQGTDQMIADGLITIPIEDQEPNPADFEILNQINGLDDQIDIQQQQVDIQQQTADTQAKQATLSGNIGANKINGQGGQGINKQRNLRGGKLENVQGKDNVPASQGGQGEIKSDYSSINELELYLTQRYKDVIERSHDIRNRKIIKSALKKNFSTIKTASQNEDYSAWKMQDLKLLFDQGDSQNKQYVLDQIKELSAILKKDDWWKIELSQEFVVKLLSNAYSNGLADAAIMVQEALYEDDRAQSSLVECSFKVSNPELLKSFEVRADALQKFVNDGIDYFMTRLALGVIAEVAEDNIEVFKNNTLEQLLNNEEFINQSATILKSGLQGVFNIKTVADGIIEKTEKAGLRKQFEYIGATIIEDELDKSKLENIKTEYYEGK